MALCPGGHDSARADVCEVCGLAVGADPAPSSFPYSQATWSAVIGTDRAYYDRVQEVTGTLGAAVAFPGEGAGRRFQGGGTKTGIGRGSAPGAPARKIPLSGPPADPGISRLHAILIA